MNQAQARQCVWERLAATARNDAAMGDWAYDESEHEADRIRLIKACTQVAKSIELRITRSSVVVHATSEKKNLSIPGESE